METVIEKKKLLCLNCSGSGFVPNEALREFRPEDDDFDDYMKRDIDQICCECKGKGHFDVNPFDDRWVCLKKSCGWKGHSKQLSSYSYQEYAGAGTQTETCCPDCGTCNIEEYCPVECNDCGFYGEYDDLVQEQAIANIHAPREDTIDVCPKCNSSELNFEVK